MRLLLVEDDIALQDDLRQSLKAAGFAVDIASDGEDGEFLGATEPYDVIVLDLGLPKRPGLDVLASWRQQGKDIPVVILTARDAWHERVDGLKAGADDYLGKPFHTEELIARIRAVMRRRHGQSHELISVAGLTLDPERQQVSIGQDNTIELTGMEFRLLHYFMLHPGRMLSKRRLSEHVYDGDQESDSNTIEVYVKRLRRKLGDNIIQTRRGQGYVFSDTK
ncbi:MAG: response regulator transcription factor [Gammaproteobacteria bacterium]